MLGGGERGLGMMDVCGDGKRFGTTSAELKRRKGITDDGGQEGEEGDDVESEKALLFRWQASSSSASDSRHGRRVPSSKVYSSALPVMMSASFELPRCKYALSTAN
ncbi:unnamed protein product [Caenorhabditis auriculariae]|uniref:Uncharacterized protein n=1 Tax=Caenorhabditis auriculariae TaxID=2777116 RepID=A0A8S1HV71_9PELO|nr:unnamed protein product [Caenorhabditis auriculariae]